MIVIRCEAAEDVAAIGAVNEQAFGQRDEAALMARLRQGSGVTLSLVALREDRVIGHILFSPVTIEPAQPDLRLVGLAPVAVLPAHQRRSIGSQLVRAGLAECRRLGQQAVVVVGYPAFYQRFGFVTAKPFGIACEFTVPEDAFMVRELEPGALSSVGGVVSYRPEFREA